ncbi:MAG: hypothetical protein IRZ09_15245 [Variibacter sp.]|nr:hypothetical protein [Variibacter sp.]
MTDAAALAGAFLLGAFAMALLIAALRLRARPRPDTRDDNQMAAHGDVPAIPMRIEQ